MNIHFIAIGGAIMHHLAICLKNLGHNVSGSDDIIFDPAHANLLKNEILPNKIGFYEENIHHGIDAIILGMHAKKDNVELQKALALGLKVYSFPAFIYEQSKQKTRVVIAGSHGKTTTTAMVMHVLKHQKIAFDYLVGSSLEGFEQSVSLTNAPIIILEGDEYLSSPIEMRSKFHFYHANIALITGIAWDHINVFPTLASYHDTFQAFIDNLGENEALFWFEEDEVLQRLCSSCKVKNENYGTPDYEIKNDVTILNTPFGQFPLNIFGKHNLQNLEGAKKVCKALGVSENNFYEAISSFKGTAKRLERIQNNKNIIAFKDFAHSPSKLAATVLAVSNQFVNKKLLACMELHTYSSTDPKFLIEFKNSMQNADIAIIYMSEKAFEIKNKTAISDSEIRKQFNQENIQVFRKP